jgi:hypothetical protein
MQALACMPCAQFNFKMVDLLNPLATIQWKRRSGFYGCVNAVVQFKGKLIASADFGRLTVIFPTGER